MEMHNKIENEVLRTNMVLDCFVGICFSMYS